MRPRSLALLLLGAFAACTPTKRTHRAVSPASGLLAADAPPPERMRMHVLDVGQGSATLFEFPCAAVLVDAGGESGEQFDSDRALREALDRFFARRTDLHRTLAAVFVTHPHLDHTRGLPLVFQHFTVQHLITNGKPRGPNGTTLESGGEQQERAEAVARSALTLKTVGRVEISDGVGLTDANIDPVSCSQVDPQISVWWGSLAQNTLGWDPKVFANANNHSLVIRVAVDGHAVLITGDLETEALHALVEAHGPKLDADVLIVGHHGSHNGSTPALLRVVTPCLAAISMGDHHRQEDWTAWAYGHPRKKAVALVAGQLGCSRPPRDVEVGTAQRQFETYPLSTGLYGTGWEGSVVFELSARGTWRARPEH